MPESVNCWTPTPNSAGQLFHTNPQIGAAGERPGYFTRAVLDALRHGNTKSRVLTALRDSPRAG
jgi:hypothetical protein